MPVFQKDGKRVLFIHVPKAGGTTVEHVFRANHWHIDFFDSGEEPCTKNAYLVCSPQHFHLDMLTCIMRLSAFDAVVATVRHPMRRIESEYRWRRQYFGVSASADAWVRAALDTYAADPFVHDNHIRPQVEFVRAPAVRIFRIEEGLGPVFRFLAARLACDFAFDDSARAMATTDAPVDVSPAVRASLRTFYHADYEELGYAED